MLVAKKNNGELIMLTEQNSRHFLRTLRLKEQFFCPQCHEPLILKVGQIKAPHFAHQQQSNCEYAFAEGESVPHLQAKQQLYTHFKSHSLQVQLEPILPNSNQRPDLLIYGKYMTAIEFQHSTIPSQLFQQRTESYIQQKIVPLWLLHTPSKIHPVLLQKVSFSAFQLLFPLTYKQNRILISYSPERRAFFYIHLLFHLYNQTYICIVDQLPLKSQTFPFYMPRQVSFELFESALHLYEREARAYMLGQLKFNRQGVQNVMLRSLYELRLSVHEVPFYFLTPIRAANCIKQFGWQSALFVFAKERQKVVWLLTTKEAKQFLQSIHIRSDEQTLSVLKRYIALCKALDITNASIAVNRRQFAHNLYRQFIAN